MYKKSALTNITFQLYDIVVTPTNKPDDILVFFLVLIEFINAFQRDARPCIRVYRVMHCLQNLNFDIGSKLQQNKMISILGKNDTCLCVASKRQNKKRCFNLISHYTLTQVEQTRER